MFTLARNLRGQTNFMSDIFVVRNQLGHYWGKKKRWVDGTDPRSVMHTKHQDESANTLFELSSHDTELRGEVIETQLTERGEPLVEPSEVLLPEAPEPGEEGATPILEDEQQP
jgi:hypothetical protein